MANPKTDGRMLRKSISYSNDFSSLSPEAAVLFCMVIPHLDSHGKLQGGPAFIKEIVCPKVKYLTINKIPTLMQEISDKTDMKWFCHDERYWIHATHFTEHQKLDTRKIGKDELPSYSEVSRELVESKSEASQELVDNKVEDKLKPKVEVELKNNTPDGSDVFILPDWIPVETWKSYLVVRKKKKAADTKYALDLVISELKKIKETHNHDPVDVLNKSITSGWTDVYPLSGGNGNGGSRYTGGTRKTFEKTGGAQSDGAPYPVDYELGPG